MTTALAHAVSFVGPSQGVVTKILESAFGDDVPFQFSVATTTQSLISVVLIFLIILALRNRFRIKKEGEAAHTRNPVYLR